MARPLRLLNDNADACKETGFGQHTGLTFCTVCADNIRDVEALLLSCLSMPGLLKSVDFPLIDSG